MLIYSISASVDGYINNRAGDFNWTAPTDEVFACHLEEVSSLGAYILGRNLYEAMRVWETEPAMRSDEARSTFADVWCALPKIVFSRTLDRVEGANTRLATGSLADEVAATLAATDKPVSIGAATLAGAAFELGLIDEVLVYRHPYVVGGGTRHLPEVQADVELRRLETRVFDSGVVYERYGRA